MTRTSAGDVLMHSAAPPRKLLRAFHIRSSLHYCSAACCAALAGVFSARGPAVLLQHECPSTAHPPPGSKPRGRVASATAAADG
jgi:hypothetical protein